MHNHGGHGHSHVPSSLRVLGAVMCLTAVIFIAELIAGWLSDSLALLSDAAHMLSDSAGLIIAFIAIVVGRRRANSTNTFGYKRTEIMAATLNAGMVTAIAVWIVVEAFLRVGHPAEVKTGLMISVAFIGLVANALSASLLTKKQHSSMNMRGAYVHVLSDLLGSVAVIVAGVIIHYTGFVLADTIASIVIALLILPQSFRLLRDALGVLLESVPSHIDLGDVRHALSTIPGVVAIHDVHVWSLDGVSALCSCHIVTEQKSDYGQCRILDSAQERLRKLGIGHTTIQLETTLHARHEEITHR